MRFHFPGILMLSRPIKGPATENIVLDMNVYGQTNAFIAHNLAKITIYVSPQFNV